MFRIFRLIHMMQKFTSKMNKESFLQKLNFDKFIEIENNVESIQHFCAKILINNVKFWNVLLDTRIKEDDLINLNNQNTEFVKGALKNWKHVSSHI